MKPKNYDLVDTALGDHVSFAVQECTEQIHCVFEEDNERKKIVSDRKPLQGPQSVDIYSEALGSFITRPITVEANDNLFSFPTERPGAGNAGGIWRPPESNENTNASRLFKVNTPGTSSNVSFTRNPATVPFKFNCCEKQTRVVVCVHCGGAYHRECFNNAGGILRANDARITCCTEATNHRMENELRKKIIREMDEKSEVMRENRELLKARVVSLEKSSFPQNELVRSLVTAMDDKCEVLTENRALLHEKISFLESGRERPERNAVSLFQKLISSEMFQQCASLLGSDINNQDDATNDATLIGLINQNNDSATVELSANSEVGTRLHPESNSDVKNGLRKPLASDKCNVLIRNSLRKRKSSGCKKRVFKNSHDVKRTIFRRKKKRVLPFKSKRVVSESINSSATPATDSFPICDKSIPLTASEKSVNSESSSASINQPPENQKSLSRDPPESVQKVSDSKCSPEVAEKDECRKAMKDKLRQNETEKVKDKEFTHDKRKRDETKNSEQIKTVRKQIISVRDGTKLVNKDHQRDGYKSSADGYLYNNTIESNPTEKDQHLTKTAAIISVPSTIGNSNKVSLVQCKKSDVKHQKVNEATADETRRIIAENPRNCSSDSSEIIKSNETITTENSNSVQNPNATISSNQNAVEEIVPPSIAKLKQPDQPLQQDTAENKKGTEAESCIKQKKTIEVQQNDKKAEGIALTKNHKFRSIESIRKENINNNGDRLHEVIKKIQDKYKTPLKIQIINSTPTKPVVVNKTPAKILVVKKVLAKTAVVNKVPAKTVVVNKPPRKTLFVKKAQIAKKALTKSPKNKVTSSKKMKNTLPHTKEDREVENRKLKDNLAADIRMAKKFFEEEKEKMRAAAMQCYSINSFTADDPVKMSSDGSDFKEETSSVNLEEDCNQWKPSDVRIQVHTEYAKEQDDRLEGLDDGEDIHVDNVNDDDAASDYPDDNFEDSIYVNEEIGEEEGGGESQVKEEDRLLDEDTMPEAPASIQSTDTIFSSIRCKEEESTQDDSKSVSALHHEIKIESDDRSFLNKDDGEDNKISLSVLVESNRVDGGNNPLVKGERVMTVDETNSEQTDNPRDSKMALKKSDENSIYSPKGSTTENNKCSKRVVAAGDKNVMYSPISDDDADSSRREQSVKKALFSSSTETIQGKDVETKKGVLKDSSASRVSSCDELLSVAASPQPTQINLLQVVKLPNNSTEQESKSKLARTSLVDQEGIAKSSSRDDQLCTYAKSGCKIRTEAEESDGEREGQENASPEDQKCTVSHREEAIAETTAGPSFPTTCNQDDTTETAPPLLSILETSLTPNTPDKKKRSSIADNAKTSLPSSSSNNPKPIATVTTRFKRPSLCSPREKSAPSTSRSPVVVRPYCWTYRTPHNTEPTPPGEETPIQEPAAQSDSPRRYNIQVRRDLTVEDLNRSTQPSENPEDPTRRYNIHVRRDLVQRSEDLAEPPGLIHVRRDLIQTGEDLSRIQVRRDLVQPPSELMVRNVGEHLCEISGQITVRRDLLPGETPAKIKVRKDLVQRSEDAPGTSRSSNQQDGGRWSIKVRKDLQQPMEDLEVTSPLNLCVQEVGTFPNTPQVGEVGAVTDEAVLNEEASKKYLKVRKDLGGLEGSSDQSGGIPEPPLNPIADGPVDESPGKRWSIKVRKDLGQTFENTEEMEDADLECLPQDATHSLKGIDESDGVTQPEEDFSLNRSSGKSGKRWSIKVRTDLVQNLETSGAELSTRRGYKLETESSTRALPLETAVTESPPVTDVEELSNTPTPLEEVEAESSPIADAEEFENPPTRLNGVKAESVSVTDNRELEDTMVVTESSTVADDQALPGLSEALEIESQRHPLDAAEDKDEEISSEVLKETGNNVEDTYILDATEETKRSDKVLKETGSNEEDTYILDATEETNRSDEVLKETGSNEEDTYILHAKETKRSDEVSRETGNNEEDILTRSEANEEISKSPEDGESLEINKQTSISNESQSKEEAVRGRVVIEESLNDEVDDEEILGGSKVNAGGILREFEVNERILRDEETGGISEVDEEANVLSESQTDEIDEDKVLNEFQNDDDEILEELEMDEEETLLNKAPIDQEPSAAAASKSPRLKRVEETCSESREVTKSPTKMCEPRETNEAPRKIPQETNESPAKILQDLKQKLELEDASEVPKDVPANSCKAEGSEFSDYEDNDASVLESSANNYDDELNSSVAWTTSPARVPVEVDPVEAASDVTLTPTDSWNVSLITSHTSDFALIPSDDAIPLPSDASDTIPLPSDASDGIPLPSDGTPLLSDTLAAIPLPSDASDTIPLPSDSLDGTPLQSDASDTILLPSDALDGIPLPSDGTPLLSYASDGIPLPSDGTPLLSDALAAIPLPSDASGIIPLPSDALDGIPLSSDALAAIPLPSDDLHAIPLQSDASDTIPLSSDALDAIPLPNEFKDQTAENSVSNILEEEDVKSNQENADTSGDREELNMSNSPDSNQNVTVLLDEEFPKPSTVPVADYIKEYRSLCAADGTATLVYSKPVEPDAADKDTEGKPDIEIEEGEIASSGDESTLVIDESSSNSRKRRRSNKTRRKSHDRHYAEIVERPDARKIKSDLKRLKKKTKKREKRKAEEVKKKFEMLYDPIDITLGEQVRFQTETFTEHVECVHDSRAEHRRIRWDKNLLRSRTRMVEIYIDALEKNVTRPITLEANDNIISVPSRSDSGVYGSRPDDLQERRGKRVRRRSRNKRKRTEGDSEDKKKLLSAKNIVNVNCDNSINQPSSSGSDRAANKNRNEFDLMDYCFTLGEGKKRKADRDEDDGSNKFPKKLLRKIDVDKFLDMIHNSRKTPL